MRLHLPLERLFGRADCCDIKIDMLAIFVLGLQDFDSSRVIEDRAKELSIDEVRDISVKERAVSLVREQLRAMKVTHKKQGLSDRRLNFIQYIIPARHRPLLSLKNQAR